MTAVLALLAGLFCTEIYLQSQPSASITASTAARTRPELRALLVPSETAHHELRRLVSTGPSSVMASIRTNSLGLRGPEPDAAEPNDALRILLLGDETIFGASLPENKTLAVRLQSLLSQHHSDKVQVLNGGVPGYSPLLSLLKYQYEWNGLKPDIVVLHFDMSDVADDAAYRKSLKESAGKQICRNSSLDPPQTEGNPLLRTAGKSALGTWFTTTVGELAKQGSAGASSTDSLSSIYQWTIDRPTDLRLEVQHAMAPLIELSTVAKQEAFQLVICSSPVPWQVTTSRHFPQLRKKLPGISEWPLRNDVPNRVLSMVCERTEIPLCDTLNAFRNFSVPERLYSGDTTELSEYGIELYARELARCLLTLPQSSQAVP